MVSLHTKSGEVALKEASKTINFASHQFVLPSLNGKTILDGNSTPVQVGQGNRSSLSVNEAPDTTSNNVDKKIITIYIP